MSPARDMLDAVKKGDADRVAHLLACNSALVNARDDTGDSALLLSLYHRQPKITRMLLACGYDDTGGDLCAHTRDVAGMMTNTPGRAVFLHNTGHSIQNERPNWLARNIVDFLEGR